MHPPDNDASGNVSQASGDQRNGHGHFARPSFSGLRDRQGIVMAPINTSRASQPMLIGDMQTPGTGYDLSFSALLPSQLLIGSPFATTTPQFQSFSAFPTSSLINAQQQAHAQQAGSPIQAQQLNSPSIYHHMNPALSSYGAPQSFPGPQYGAYGMVPAQYPPQIAPSNVSTNSRTVYLGNIPSDVTAEELLGHVRSGPIESIRLLSDKNCAFISFLDPSSAIHFHSDAILKKLSIRGSDIKIGWGKPSQVPSSVAIAVQQSAASRNVYLGNLPVEVTEDELREDLSKFGAIDTVKLVREKAIGFVHFLTIGAAIKAVSQLPQDPKWQHPRRVFYGKDRCAYVSKTQQQNAAQYLGIAPNYSHVMSSSDRDMLSNNLAQQSIAAAAVATAAGGVNNLGNRTVYLGNIHPETTTEEICNVVRGGLLHHIRYIPDKHICFVTFIDPTAAAQFFALSNVQGLMIHNRRLKIGWGKHSGALPPAIALAVSGGASRNVYIGNIDESWTEDRFRQDFAAYGDIELVNTLREKSCAFVNFTNIANAIKAIEGIRGKDDYKRFKVNFGKDRCGNQPRQQNASMSSAHNVQTDCLHAPSATNGDAPIDGSRSSSTSVGNGPAKASAHAGFHSVGGNALTQYLHQLSQSQNHHAQQSLTQLATGYLPPQPHGDRSRISQKPASEGMNQEETLRYGHDLETRAVHAVSLPNHQDSHAGHSAQLSQHLASNLQQQRRSPPSQQHYSSHISRNSFAAAASNTYNSSNGPSGSLLTPSFGLVPAQKSQHARALSMPAFSQMPTAGHQSHLSNGGGISALTSGLGGLGFGAGISGYSVGESNLPRWAEEEVGS